jgi:hypothetical protein
MTEERAQSTLGLPKTEGTHKVSRQDTIDKPFFAFLH